MPSSELGCSTKKPHHLHSVSPWVFCSKIRRSNLQMVSPSSMLVVKLCAKCMAKCLAVRRHPHCTSALNWELPLLCSLLQDHNRLRLRCTDLVVYYKLWPFLLWGGGYFHMRVHLRMYHCQILLQQFSLGMRPHKSQMHNYVSTSAENGPAMAGPAGPARPVLAPMLLST